MGKVAATLSFGADFKKFEVTSYNELDNLLVLQFPTNGHTATIPANIIQTLPVSHASLEYFPLNIGINGSVPDTFGTTFFNANANFNILPILSDDKAFAGASYTTNARAHYVVLQLGADRVQTIYKDWTVKLHADGQWADGPLFSNEQFGMGGVAGVRGYTDGLDYGDTGWRMSIEPQTPLVNIGMVGNEGHQESSWLRGSVFMDYGELYRYDDTPGLPGSLSGLHTLRFWGTGFALTANIGNHVDARLTLAFPLLEPDGQPGFHPERNMHIYFGVGAQF
jgi:hemolysin activation/secretion protein